MPQRDYLLGAGVGCCTFGLLPPGAGVLPGLLRGCSRRGATLPASRQFCGRLDTIRSSSDTSACSQRFLRYRLHRLLDRNPDYPLFLSTYP